MFQQQDTINRKSEVYEIAFTIDGTIKHRFFRPFKIEIMKYLIVDAELSGTGVRDKYLGGYIDPEDFALSEFIKQRLGDWLLKYENEHYNGFTNENLIIELDQEGRDIALVIKNELLNVKVEYFSAAKMTREIIV